MQPLVKEDIMHALISDVVSNYRPVPGIVLLWLHSLGNTTLNDYEMLKGLLFVLVKNLWVFSKNLFISKSAYMYNFVAKWAQITKPKKGFMGKWPLTHFLASRHAQIYSQKP
jgi:hypothetical protein